MMRGVSFGRNSGKRQDDAAAKAATYSFGSDEQDTITGPRKLNAIYIPLKLISVVFWGLFAAFVSAGSSLQRASAHSVGGLPVLAWFFIVFAIVVVIGVIYLYLYWKRYTWELTTTHLTIRSGVIFKNRIQIPIERVQTLDVAQGILERLLGIGRLVIDTAAGSNNRKVAIQALRLAEAQTLRTHIFMLRDHSGDVAESLRAFWSAHSESSWKSGAPSDQEVPVSQQGTQPDGGTLRQVEQGVADFRGVMGGQYEESTKVECSYKLANKELLLCAICNIDHRAILGIAFGFFAAFSSAILPIGISDPAFFTQMNNTIIFGVAGATVLMVLVSILAIWILTVIINIFNFGGFSAQRRGGRVEATSGLLSRHSKSAAIERIQSVKVKQGIIQRIIGYATVSLDTVDAATDNNSNSSNNSQAARPGIVIHPFIKVGQAEALVNAMVGEFEDRPDPKTLKALPKVAKRRAINRRTIIPGLIAIGVTVAVFALCTLMGRELYALKIYIETVCVIITVFILVYGFFSSIWWYKRSAYGHSDKFLAVRSGTFDMVMEYIPRSKAQWLSNTANPFQRRLGLSSFSAYSAAGVRGKRYKIRDITYEEGMEYIEWMRPHGSKYKGSVA